MSEVPCIFHHKVKWVSNRVTLYWPLFLRGCTSSLDTILPPSSDLHARMASAWFKGTSCVHYPRLIVQSDFLHVGNIFYYYFLTLLENLGHLLKIASQNSPTRKECILKIHLLHGSYGRKTFVRKNKQHDHADLQMFHIFFGNWLWTWTSILDRYVVCGTWPLW